MSNPPTWPRLAAVALVAQLAISATPSHAFSVSARDSSLEVRSFALNAACNDGFGGVLATAASADVSSGADLSVAGDACYVDGFGRHFVGAYAAVQDVSFTATSVQAVMGQVLTAEVISEGFPAARTFELSSSNLIELNLDFTGPTTLALDLVFTGQPGSLLAHDFVRLNIYAQSISGLPAGSLFDLNSSGALSGVPFSTELVVNPNPAFRYFLAAATQGKAGADSSLSSSLNFTVSSVPEPQAWALWLGGLAAVTWLGRRSRRLS
jgi:hypothetical protein